MSTNIPYGTNSFNVVISPASTNRHFFAFYRTDLPAGDTDGDGVPDGTEKFIDGTDPANPHDPPNISGTVSYSGWMHPGASIIVRAHPHQFPWSNITLTLTEPGHYQFSKLPLGSGYNISAFVDQDGNKNQHLYEPYDIIADVFATGQVLNVNFHLVDSDSDNDGMPDWWEYMYFGHYTNTLWYEDADGDTLTNVREYQLRTDPTKKDTDDDGMGDAAEVAWGFDPLVPPVGHSEYQRLPFTETFESPGIVTGDLNGQNRWTAAPAGQALVQTGVGRSGSQAVALTGGSEAATIEHLVGTVGESVVWIDMYASIDLASGSPYRDYPDISEAPAHTVSVFSMNADGDIYAYNGNSHTWVLATQSGGIPGNTYHRYTVKQNYTSKTWDLYIDGVQRLVNLGFRDASVVEFTLFSVKGTKDGNVFCDDISISTTKPAGIP